MHFQSLMRGSHSRGRRGSRRAQFTRISFVHSHRFYGNHTEDTSVSHGWSLSDTGHVWKCFQLNIRSPQVFTSSTWWAFWRFGQPFSAPASPGQSSLISGELLDWRNPVNSLRFKSERGRGHCAELDSATAVETCKVQPQDLITLGNIRKRFSSTILDSHSPISNLRRTMKSFRKRFAPLPQNTPQLHSYTH